MRVIIAFKLITRPASAHTDGAGQVVVQQAYAVGGVQAQQAYAVGGAQAVKTGY